MKDLSDLSDQIKTRALGLRAVYQNVDLALIERFMREGADLVAFMVVERLRKVRKEVEQQH